MEKVKAFVIKHQLWFKLAALALLIAMLFTPFTFIVLPVSNEIHSFSILYYLSVESNLSPYIALFSISICICIITAFIAIILLLSIWKKSDRLFLSISLVSFGVLVLFYLSSFFLSFYTWGSYTYEVPSIPHIAFYLLLILSIFISFVVYFVIKNGEKGSPSTNGKKQNIGKRIKVTENKIKELENRKDD